MAPSPNLVWISRMVSSIEAPTPFSSFFIFFTNAMVSSLIGHAGRRGVFLFWIFTEYPHFSLFRLAEPVSSSHGHYSIAYRYHQNIVEMACFVDEDGPVVHGELGEILRGAGELDLRAFNRRSVYRGEDGDKGALNQVLRFQVSISSNDDDREHDGRYGNYGPDVL